MITVHAQKKEPMRYFSREVTIQDSITLSLIEQYIQKFPDYKVVSMSVDYAKDTIYYHLEAVAHQGIIKDIVRPYFIFEHKKCFVLINSRITGLYQGNEAFSQYLERRLRKYLKPGDIIKDEGNGVKSVTMMTLDLPLLSVKRTTRGFLELRWSF
jgi:hypothetical protein